MSLKLGSQTGSFVNYAMSTYLEKDPVIGDGVTILRWTDRTAATVIDIEKSGKVVTIQEDVATRTDTNGMSDSQSYTYSSNPEGRIYMVKRLKAGWKIFEGRDEEAKRNRYGSLVVFGVRRAYHDYSF